MVKTSEKRKKKVNADSLGKLHYFQQTMNLFHQKSSEVASGAALKVSREI